MKKLEVIGKAGREDCDFPLYKDLPLPVVMLQGWFNDQHDCFKLFFRSLTCDEQAHFFTNTGCYNSVKTKYKDLWDIGEFKKNAMQHRGEHKRLDHLVYASNRRRGFAYWSKCVFNAINSAGSLDTLLQNLGTVEVAHSEFKPWFYKSKTLIRGLNAADAARILARYGYLIPESRPLLARGALRGAAILVNGESPSKTVKMLNGEYEEEAKRSELEENSANYIRKHKLFSGKFQMEEGESWFCNEIHKNRYPEPR